MTLRCKSSTTDSSGRSTPSEPPELHPKKVFSKSKKKQELANQTQPKPLNRLDLKGPKTKPNNHFQAVSELDQRDPALGVVENIFQSRWTGKMVPKIVKVLRVHNTIEVQNRFEAYREVVKRRAAEMPASMWKERCVADGNEVLRFHGTSLTCHLGEHI